MLKPLANPSLVSESDRCKYADDSMALTAWLDENGKYIAFELIFDLTMDEHAVRRLGTKPGRYFRLDEGENRPGRHGKQTYEKEKPLLPGSRLEDFQDRSADLPYDLACYVRETLLQLLEPNSEMKVDDESRSRGD